MGLGVNSKPTDTNFLICHIFTIMKNISAKFYYNSNVKKKFMAVEE